MSEPKLFHEMTNKEKLEYMERHHREMPDLFNHYLITPMADIWDWHDYHVPWLIGRIRELENRIDP